MLVERDTKIKNVMQTERNQVYYTQVYDNIEKN